MKLEYYTYAYLREDKTPYYVGKGKGKRAYRKRKGEVRPPRDKSRVIFLKQNLSEEEAFKHEIYMIAVYGRKDLGTGILYNRTNGGDAPPVFTGHTEESKNKIRNTCKGRNLGPGMSDEAKKRMSEYNKKMKIKPPLHMKSFKLVSPAGEIFEGENITQFCISKNLNPTSIYDMRRGKQSQHMGWTLSCDDKIEKNKRSPKYWNRPGFGQKYCLKSPNNELYYVVVGELSAFANENNLLPNGVSRLIGGKRKTYRGWKLVK